MSQSLPPDWTPTLRTDFDFSKANLEPEEGFVLSRLDGSTPIQQLAFLTGLQADRIDEILDRLIEVGAVVAPESPDDDIHGGSDDDDGSPFDGPELRDDGNWRKVFERDIHPLPLDRRVEMAGTCSARELRPLCFDPSPKVAQAIFENESLGLEHARLVARHHRSTQGLIALGQEPAFLRDRQVQAELFRNPQTPEALLNRVLQRKRLDQLYSLSVGHESTERVRKACQRTFRQSFSRAGADERVQLILKTDGRCLSRLSGVPLDGKAAALLCRRPITSPLLIRNLARWASTPPLVLQHLFRQAAVKRSPDLKNQILRHPNAPSKLGD